MRFKDFLQEAKHRQDISVEKALDLFMAHCEDVSFRRPMWRGSRKMTEDAYLIQGELGERVSANTSNHYTILMDRFLPKFGFPRRSQSIIFASHDNEEYTRMYGKVYAIFPFDGVPIGVANNEEDIWHVRFKIGASRTVRPLEQWNDFFANAGIPDYSYEDLVQGIKDTLENPEDEHYHLFEDVFRKPEYVEEVLEEAYTPPNLNVSVMTSKKVSHLTGAHELWTSGKCVAIRKDVWEALLSAK